MIFTLREGRRRASVREALLFPDAQPGLPGHGAGQVAPDAGQEWKINYLRKWRAMQEMKVAGDEFYDLNGRVNEGISQFKQGFGPAETTWVGAFDAVYHPLLYAGWSRGLPLARRLLRRAG